MTSITCIYNAIFFGVCFAIKLAAHHFMPDDKAICTHCDKFEIVSLKIHLLFERIFNIKIYNFGLQITRAISKVVLVRVDGSKKRLKINLSLQFLISEFENSRIKISLHFLKYFLCLFH